MTIIDRYVSRAFLSSYAILLVVGIGMYVLFDILANIDEFTATTGMPTGRIVGLMVDYYGHNLPLYFSQLAGPVMAIAAAFTLGAMLRNNELTSLVASGLPLPRVAAPIAVCSVLLIALWVANRELVIPRYAEEISRTYGDVMGRNVGGVNCIRDDQNSIVTALRLYAGEGRMYHVYAVESDADGNARALIEADSATYDAERRLWALDRGRRIPLDALPTTPSPLGEALHSDPIDSLRFDLTPGELLLRQGTQWSDLLSLRQMNELLRSPSISIRPAIVSARHIRLTQPVLQLLLVLLATPFFLQRAPTNVVAAGGRALLVCGVFFGLAFAVHAIEVGEQWTATAAWIPILIFAPVAVLMLSNVET
ncbi:MAG: LptF/LptG family permease [Phycisphaerae bacterium]